MAPRQTCPECRNVLYSQSERYEPKGTTVIYVCRNGTCPSNKRRYPYKVKKFISAR